MTEIPEHLLARSRARRAAAGLGGADAPATGGEVEVAAGAAPAPTAASVPATPAAPAPPPPPPPPTPPYIKAFEERRKIPYWVMPVLLSLPLWLFFYANTLVKPSASQEGPLAEGKTLYSKAGCASCHGAAGEGGVGPSFQAGAVVKTFPDYKDQIRWVHLGSANWPDPTYGAENKPIGAGGMPAFGQKSGGAFTDLEIAKIVRYEREGLAAAEPEPDLVAITEGASPPLDDTGKPTG